MIGIQSFFDSLFSAVVKTTYGGSSIATFIVKEEIVVELEKMALETYKALKCEVYFRIDMIVTEQGIPYILEVNTLPGMTKNSLIPKSATALNISFSKLIDMIIEH